MRKPARRFAADRRGAAAVVFAVALVPLVLGAGAAIDYATVFLAKTELDHAADGAVLSVVNRGALTLDTAAAQKAAVTYFNDAAALRRVNGVSTQASVSDTSGNRTVTLQYSADVATAFMAFAGIPSVKISGSSQSIATAPIFTDFYLLLDNTPSMGVGATQADITTMVNQTSDRCAFACHDLSANGKDYYALAKKLGVTLRIDVVRQATQKLMDKATASALVPGQFRAALYTMGTSCTLPNLTLVSALSSDLSAAKANATAIDLMTIPYQGFNNDQCTDFDGVLASLNTAIPGTGDGLTAQAPQKVVFLVSDGVADAYYPTTCTKPTTGGRCQEPITVTTCRALKARGVRVAVLYTTYLPLPTNGWYNQWIAPFQSSIGTQMQACASPGLYFEVSPTQGIADAMLALFDQVVKQTRLSQ